MPILVCPTCRKRFDSNQSTAMPFCSGRCRAIDLGRWLNEEYGLPIEDQPDECEEAEEE